MPLLQVYQRPQDWERIKHLAMPPYGPIRGQGFIDDTKLINWKWSQRDKWCWYEYHGLPKWLNESPVTSQPHLRNYFHLLVSYFWPEPRMNHRRLLVDRVCGRQIERMVQSPSTVATKSEGVRRTFRRCGISLYSTSAAKCGPSIPVSLTMMPTSLLYAQIECKRRRSL